MMNEIVTEEQEILDEARESKDSRNLAGCLIVLALLALLAVIVFTGIPFFG
jgi:cytochrome b